MPMYAFTECPDDSIEQLEKIAEFYKLKEVNADAGKRKWVGEPFPDPYQNEIMVQYEGNKPYPLRVIVSFSKQNPFGRVYSHTENEGLKTLIGDLLRITQSPKMVSASAQDEYNLDEFLVKKEE